MSTFTDPQIIKLLQERFVPVAIDQWYQRQQEDREGDYYRRIVAQGPRANLNATTQGLYTCTAEGKLLGFNNNRSIERCRELLQNALRNFQPEGAPALEAGTPDPRFVRRPPAGGLVVNVYARVLSGYEAPADRFQQAFQSSLGRDHLWILRDEHEALTRGEFPARLARRIARFHLIDNTRGEPPMWRDDEVKRLNLTLSGGRITGTAELQTDTGHRGYEASLYGVVETKAGKVTRFDLVARGMFWGEGVYTRGAPKGKFPFAVAFSLAAGTAEADRVPPQGTKGDLAGYLR